MYKNKYSAVMLTMMCVLLLHRTAMAATYYSSPNGSGTICSINSPCSLNNGLGKLSAGDTLYLRGGTYRQSVNFSRNGKSGNPITIAGYPNETAVIDGYNTIPSHWGTLFNILGNWVIVRDLEIKDSFSMGLVMRADHDSAINVYAHGNYENGILVSAAGSSVGSGKYALIEGCRVYYNNKEERLGLRSNWSSGCSLQQGASHGVIRKCKVWENGGEGLSVFSYSCSNPTDYALVEDNIVYDNGHANLYLQNTRHTIVQRNIVYSTKSDWGTSAGGIQVQNELACNHNDDIKILNNFVMNANNNNFVRWYSSSAGGSFTNWVIAGNTFVNANTSNCIKIEPGGGTPSNNLIADNIFIQQDSSAIANVPAGYATWSHNFWSKTADSDARGPGDAIGDPRIEGGSWGAGTLTAEYFKLKNDSPARDAGITVSDLTEDFFGTARTVGDSPDMGGYEHTDILAKFLIPPEDFRLAK
jgi:hypothetical protein